mmetsp:Transcript_19967/g.33422  ORF Transcript_19967/g.33422 Transcript_19967/m.33422 type:complete len:532 (-) Transcript_19967:698-2293(-)
MFDEIKNMLHYRVGHYKHLWNIPPEERPYILNTFMFMKHKTDADGVYTRTKARLVGNGARQGQHMYDLVASTTVGLAAVFLLLNIASYFNIPLSAFDIKGAFLNAMFGPEDKVTYIRISREVAAEWVTVDPAAKAYLTDRGELLLELDKFIYGLKQSPLKFQQHLVKTLQELGYKRLEQDECLFIKRDGDDFSLLSTHVDDILMTYTKRGYFTELRDGLIAAYGTVTDAERADEYLGMGIERSSDGKHIKLTQLGLVERIVDEYASDLAESRSSRATNRTPAGPDLFEESPDSERIDSKKYLRLVMTLMYLARLTRPDILQPVTYLASRAAVATKDDWNKCLRIVRYVAATKWIGIVLCCTLLQILVWCDAAFGSHSDGKGHSGFNIGLGTSYLHARSAKQKVGSTSSTESEIIAKVEALKMAVWLRELLRELNLVPLQPIKLFQDNQSAILVVTQTGRQKQTKHLLTKIGFVRDLVTSGAVIVEYLSTLKMIADMLTKPLQGPQFRAHRNTMMGLIFIHLFMSGVNPDFH